jgi:hypothetical protein
MAPDPMEAFAFDVRGDAFEYAFDEDGDGDVSKEELRAWMHGLGQTPTDDDLDKMLDKSSPASMDACFQLVPHEPPGLHATTTAEACDVIVQLAMEVYQTIDKACTFEVGHGKIAGVPNGTILSQICPKQCGAKSDLCGVIGGDDSSCAAAVLAQAWDHCPQACLACDVNRRGCFSFSSTFISSLGIIAYAGLAIGTALYSAYLKAVPYHKLLIGSHLLLALFSACDWLTIAAVDSREGDPAWTEGSVVGIDGHAFALFDGEAHTVSRPTPRTSEGLTRLTRNLCAAQRPRTTCSTNSS